MWSKKAKYTAVGILTLVASLVVPGFFMDAHADRLTSPSYQIDTSVALPFGGQASSANYKLVTGGGEAAASSGASSNYKLGYGYVAQLEKSIQLSILNPSVNFGNLTSGVSKTLTIGSEIYTDAPGYTIGIAQNNNLTSAANTIPAISLGTIATPASWSEGATKGLGFSLTAAPNLNTKWGTVGNYKYAAFPASATSVYTRSGYTGGVKDTISMQGRLDIDPSQAQGSYSNIVTLSATIIP